MDRLIRCLIVTILLLCMLSFVKVAAYYSDYFGFNVEAECVERSGF